jgi:methyl-accepting chemotaxis protein
MERTMSKRYPVIGKVVDVFGNWLKHRREVRELHGLDNGEFAKIARELNMTSADLDSFVHQGPHASDELPKLLTRLGLDSLTLSQTQPVVLRDMVRVCASCQQKRQCDRDLAAGTSEQKYEDYCPNASAIDELKTTVDRSLRS